jgi:hypothetical protein
MVKYMLPKRGERMYTIEFIARAENGVIRLPKEYEDVLTDEMRVIILTKNPVIKKDLPSKISFKAVKINTKNFRFNREDANER